MKYHPQQVVKLRFKLRKKYNGFFILKSCAYFYSDIYDCISNYVSVINSINRYTKISDCSLSH